MGATHTRSRACRRPAAVTRPALTPGALAAGLEVPELGRDDQRLRTALPAADDDYEVRGERRPEALVVPTEFRDFQACRQRAGG